MTRKRSKAAGAQRRRRAAALQAIASGAFLVILPGMLASSPLTEPLKSLRPIGAMLFAVGVVLLLVQRLLFRTRAPKENSAATAKQPRASRHLKPTSPADRACRWRA